MTIKTFVLKFDWNWRTNKLQRPIITKMYKIYKKRTLHLHLMHFCSPCDGSTGCHSWPFSYIVWATLHPPLFNISSADFILPNLEPWSFSTSVSIVVFFSTFVSLIFKLIWKRKMENVLLNVCNVAINFIYVAKNYKYQKFINS